MMEFPLTPKPSLCTPPKAARRPERVFLRVYDLGSSDTTTTLMRGFGLTRHYGAYHSGVEVYGTEWSFGQTDNGRTGIECTYPGKHPGHRFKETMALGYTNLTREEVAQVIEEMRFEWRGDSYRLLTK